MEESLYQDINATLDPKATWKPDAIWFPTNWGTATSEEEAEWVNLMDYIGKDGTKEVLKIEKREMWSDPLNKESRQSLVTEIENVCAVAGFQIFCKGWEGQRMCMHFDCARGRLYKDQKKPRASKQYNTKTARPKTIEDKCKFGFTIYWDDGDYGGWIMKGGVGCNIHNGHPKKQFEDVRRMVKCLPEEEEEIAQDCFTVNSKADTVQALVQRRTGFVLTKGQAKYLREAGRKKVLA